jgi:hypothetical protein
LEGVVIPGSVTVIGESAFENNRITEVILGSSVGEIGGMAFAGNPLIGVIIPGSVHTIGSGAFGDGTLFTYNGRIISQKELAAELREKTKP